MKPNSLARELSLKFLYQCETEKIYYFSENHFNSFTSYFKYPPEVIVRAKHLCKGVFEKIESIDQHIEQASEKWSLDRMAIIDKSCIRIGVFELTEGQEPKKVVLNEAIEYSKQYGSAQSGAFVNGILDKIAVKLCSKTGTA